MCLYPPKRAFLYVWGGGGGRGEGATLHASKCHELEQP